MGLRSRLAVVFDAFGTLFDVHSIAALAEALFPKKGHALSQTWRVKQLEYCFLRTIGDRYTDFWHVTGSALDYAAEQLALPLTSEERRQLMNAYLHLAPFPESLAVLQSIQQTGGNLAILSNGSPIMLESVVRDAGMEGIFAHLLSADRIRKYKPDPLVYQLACDAFALDAQQIIFVSSNGWDISGAGWYGFKTFWVNRQLSPIEHLDAVPDATGSTLDALLGYLHQIDSAK